MEIKPVFREAGTGVYTQCEDCDKIILPSEWFHRYRDEDGVLKWLCSPCYKKKTQKDVTG